MNSGRARASLRRVGSVITLVALATTFAGCGSDDASNTPSATRDASFERVSVAEVSEAIAAKESLLVDVREQQEWDAGHAPRALHVPLGEFAARLDEVRDAADGRPVVIICRSGNRSAQAAQIAVDGGLDDVSSVDGGMGAWVEDGQPIVPPGGRIA